MHITDRLCKARRERDESQARYEQALAEHREAYPCLAIEERTEAASGATERLQQVIAENCQKMYAAEDMTDPANWRAGDFIQSDGYHPDLTDGKLYQVISMDSDNDPIIDDDADKHIARPAFCFRFHSRP